MAPRSNGLNALPDCLLCLILGKVPLKQAIRCSVLSKRWKCLWRLLPNLSFSVDFFYSSYNLLEIPNIIDSILNLHSATLEFFQLHNVIHSLFHSGKVNEWIHHAAVKEVREMSIQASFPLLRMDEVPTSVFSCRKLRYLALTNLCLTDMPGSFGGFACLTTLYFHNVQLTGEKTFELMLQLCPVLEVLSVCNCNGLERLKICCDNLMILNLDFPHPSSSSEIKEITANCPRLVSLTIKVQYHVEKMEFELPTCLHLSTTVARVSRLKPFTTLKSLTKMTFLSGIYESDESFLHEFPDLKQICIDNAKYTVRGAMQHISGPSLSLENLEQVHLNVASLNDAMPLLTYLLQRAPAMKTLIVSRQQGFDGALEFFNTLFNLPRASPEAKILLSLNNFEGSEIPQL